MLLRHLRYLLAVAEHGNFTRAADALHVSQPTLSQQIKQLEELLQVQLLDRSGRMVRLTDAGTTYLHYVRNALRELEAGRRAIQDIQDLSRGELRIGLTPNFTHYLVGPLMERFNEHYPHIAIQLLEMTQDGIEAALAEDKLELGIAFVDAQGHTRSAEIASRPLFTEKLSLITGTAHRAKPKKLKLSIDNLQGEALALLTGDFATRQHIDRFFKVQGVAPPVAMEANSINAIVEIVRHGKLFTILPDYTVSMYEGLRPLQLEPALPPRTVALLRRKGAYVSAAARAFETLLIETVKDYPLAAA